MSIADSPVLQSEDVSDNDCIIGRTPINSATAVYCRLSEANVFSATLSSMSLFVVAINGALHGRKRTTVGGLWLIPDTDGLTDGIHCHVCRWHRALVRFSHLLRARELCTSEEPRDNERRHLCCCAIQVPTSLVLGVPTRPLALFRIDTYILCLTTLIRGPGAGD